MKQSGELTSPITRLTVEADVTGMVPRGPRYRQRAREVLLSKFGDLIDAELQQLGVNDEGWPWPSSDSDYGTCSGCGGRVRVLPGGAVIAHDRLGTHTRCPGSGEPPAE